MKRVTKEEIIDIIKKVDVLLNADEIDPDKDLTEQGVDSLDLVNIYFSLEENYSIEITDESIEDQEWSTLNKIVNNVNKYLSS